ncbi:MAG: hypothetical protein M1820_003141 [Bogoriella megaspora]|nr:MAG: hypothetical protein M1820_003141 [Bogoriella megaspora]
MAKPSYADILAEIETLYSNDSLLSPRGQKILELLNERDEILLESALLRSQNDNTYDESADSEEELQAAVTKARAAYVLRNKIVQDVIITDPILKAVHAGSNATPLERKLLSLVDARDSLSMLQSHLAQEISQTYAKLADAEKSNFVVIEKNKKLTEELLSLVEQTRAQTNTEATTPDLRSHLEALDHETKPLRQKWRVLKGVLAGSIVGSGVDWARDPALQELVLDYEDELD